MTQQQLDYAVCMWYQSTLEQQTPKSQLEQITSQSQRWSINS